MSNWAKVGDWLKENAGTGTALVGSLLSGNAPGAIAAGISLVSGATGTDDPAKVLERLQTSPETMVKLRELAVQEEADIRQHIRLMHEADLKDAQAQHTETQQTIRSGDNAADKFVRWTRPGQSWLSLMAGFIYVLITDTPDPALFGMFLTLPWAYAGLRQVGKGVDAYVTKKANS